MIAGDGSNDLPYEAYKLTSADFSDPTQAVTIAAEADATFNSDGSVVDLGSLGQPAGMMDESGFNAFDDVEEVDGD